jgi:cytochrome c2
MSTTKVFTNATGAPLADNTNIMTAGPRGPALLQDIWLIEKLAQFDREVIPERRMHAKGWGFYGTLTVTHDITRLARRRSSARSASIRRCSPASRPSPASAPIALAAGNPTAGKSIFASHCAVCHSTQSGVTKIGPSLAGIVGSKSGLVPGFDFSAAMKNAGVTWNDANLDKFLDPQGFIQGTKMFVNLPSEADRENVIAYLNTLQK